jgi:hypothetical protein
MDRRARLALPDLLAFENLFTDAHKGFGNIPSML